MEAVTTQTIISIFTVYYILAQIIERVTELFSPWFCKREIEELRREMEDIEKIIDKKIANSGGLHNIEQEQKGRKEKRDELLKLRARRIAGLWFLASVMGIILCGLIGVRFFETAGITVSPWLDKILTGLLIGSGTKPLHDLIVIIEKSVKT